MKISLAGSPLFLRQVVDAFEMAYQGRNADDHERNQKHTDN